MDLLQSNDEYSPAEIPRDIIRIPRADYKLWCTRRHDAPLESPYSSPWSNGDSCSLSRRYQNTSAATTTTKTQSSFELSLPPELLLEILSYLKDSQATLYAASFVCRQWLQCVTPLLYRHAQINDTYRWATFILTLTRDKKSFLYGDIVHSVDLSGCRSLDSPREREVIGHLITERTPAVVTPESERERTAVASTAGVSTTHATQTTLLLPTDNDHHHDPDHSLLIEPSHIVVSTSSLIQLARSCKFLTSLNLSFTLLLYDSVIAETGEYLSTLQHYAIQPGLTQIQIPMAAAIEALGRECKQLQEVKMQRCSWVTAHTIWLWVTHCKSLERLDARRCTKCTVKRLVANPLAAEEPECGDAVERDDSLGNGNSDDESRSGSSVGSYTDHATVFNFTVDEVVDDEEEDEDEEEPQGNDAEVQDRPNSRPMGAGRSNPHTGAPFLYPSRLAQHATGTDAAVNDGALTLTPPGMRATSTRQTTEPRSGASGTSSRRTLHDIVLDILCDAKTRGALDLGWLPLP